MSTKYTKELLEEAVKNSLSCAGVLRYLGLKQAGGTQAYISQKIKKFELDTSHWHRQAHNKGKISLNRKTPEQILIVLSPGSNRPKTIQLRRAMLECGVAHRCAGKDCSNPEPVWAGKPLTLEVDHVNGNWLDNTLENVRFLCPNCHSQEENSNRPHKYRTKDNK